MKIYISDSTIAKLKKKRMHTQNLFSRNNEQANCESLNIYKILMCWCIKCLNCLTILNKYNFTKWHYYVVYNCKAFIKNKRNKQRTIIFLIKPDVYYSVKVCLTTIALGVHSIHSELFFCLICWALCFLFIVISSGWLHNNNNTCTCTHSNSNSNSSCWVHTMVTYFHSGIARR